MKHFKKFSSKLWAAVLSIVLVLVSVPTVVFTAIASDKMPVQIAVMSDIHYFADSMKGNDCDAYKEWVSRQSRQFDECSVLLDTALKTFALHAKSNGIKYILIPGDVSKDGEYDAHFELAQKLEAFEQETGIQVIVTNGNHDINNSSAMTFKSGEMQSARKTTPEEFKEIYKNLGWDLACDTYVPETGKAGMLSYAVRLDGGYRLIVMDTCMYSADVNNGSDEHLTDGQITDAQMEWVLEQIAEAKENGETVIGMSHHSVVPHCEIHNTIFKSFIIDDWTQRTEALADAGMDFVFTGHMHDFDIAGHVSDNGNKLYDISTSSLTGYTNFIREVLIDNSGDVATADVKSFDIDCEYQITVDGVTYDRPYKNTHSYAATFGSDIEEFAMNMVSGYVRGFCDAVKTEGSVVAALKSQFGLDVEELIKNLIGGGVSLGPVDIFTTKNIMSFINDLDKQLQEEFLSDPDALLDYVRLIINELLSMQVSKYPCTKFIESNGFGNANKPGTLMDAAMSTLVYYYNGDQDISGDVFMLDVIEYFKDGTGANDLFDLLYDIVLNNLLQSKLLGNLSLNVNTLFPSGTIGHLPAQFLDFVLGLVLKGDKSYENVINSFLSLGLIKNFDSINGIADHYIEEYLTQSQFDSIGYMAGSMIEALVTENDSLDKNVKLYATEDDYVEATTENYRLPTMITTTLGDDSSTEANIGWYSKYSLTSTDIQISATDGGKMPTVVKSSANVTREYPAVDLGVIGFMTIEDDLVRHSVKLTGMTPGKTYRYRVGNADKDWWSEYGTITTADGSDKLTFIHITDPQSQNARQYETFHGVITAAMNKYPDAKFIVSSGDQVDSGSNVHQWKWLLDVSSDVLMSKPFMPTTGNHEDDSEALTTNFVLPNVPEQNLETGVYYSYDYNNAHFMVLNTNDLNEDEGLSDTQLSWLKENANSSDAQWKIVVLHKATYSNGSHYDDDDVVAMRAQFKKLMPELDIDIVLEGHDHVYLRTDAMYNNRVTKTKNETVSYLGNDYDLKTNPYGTFYVISGCSGVKTYVTKDPSETDKLFPRAEALYDTSLPIFSSIQIDGSSLYFDAYTVDESGEITRIDNFAIQKNGESSPCPITNIFGSDGQSDEADIDELQISADEAYEVAVATGEIIEGIDVGYNNTTTTTVNNIGGAAEEEAVTAKKTTAVNANDTTAGATATTSSVGEAVTSANASGSGATTTVKSNGSTEVYGGVFYANETTVSNGNSEDGEDVADGALMETQTIMTFGEKIPLLGGSSPIIASSAVFGIAFVAMMISKKRKKDD